jgi:hypothetical protein
MRRALDHVATAHFHHELTHHTQSPIALRAIEIRNVVAELVLSPEFESHHLSITKQLPHQGPGARLLFAQLAGEVRQAGHVITASVMFGLVHRRSLLLNFIE